MIMSRPDLYNRIQMYRTQAGLTQAELAERVGVTRQTIISIEKGNYEPSVLLALQLAATLNETVEVLFYYESKN